MFSIANAILLGGKQKEECRSSSHNKKKSAPWPHLYSIAPRARQVQILNGINSVYLLIDQIKDRWTTAITFHTSHHITPSPIIHLHRLQRGVNCKVRIFMRTCCRCGRLHGSSPKHSKVLFLTQRIFYSQPRALLYYSVGSTSRRGLNQSVPNTPTLPGPQTEPPALTVPEPSSSPD